MKITQKQKCTEKNNDLEDGLKKNNAEEKRKKCKELDIKIKETRKIQYTNNKYPRRKQKRKRNIQGYNTRKLKVGEKKRPNKMT